MFFKTIFALYNTSLNEFQIDIYIYIRKLPVCMNL